MKQSNKAIFLDRDGVINKTIIFEGKTYPPKDISELRILPKVKSSLKLLKKKGFLLIVITNQPDVARKKANIKDVETLNQFIMKSLCLDAIFTCYHDESDNCLCRKPKPGNIIKAAEKFNINLKKSFMIGDRWKDIDAGKIAGCKTFFIDYSYNEKQPKNFNYKVESLYEATKIILGL